MRFSLKKEDRKIPDTHEITPISLPETIPQTAEPEVINIWDYVRVVNVRGTPEFQATAEEKVIVAHRGNPVLGNKHPMIVQTMEERSRVIAEYKEDLKNDLSVQGPMYKALQDIAKLIVETRQKVAFACYCLPCDCHALELVPVVVNMAEKLLEQNSIYSEKTPQVPHVSKPKF